MTGRKYGYRKDTYDPRDLVRAAAHPAATQYLPSKHSNLPLDPPVYDQLQTGSCTGNAWAAGFEQIMHKEKLHLFRPSRLAIYYDERVIEGTTDQDAGAMIRTGAKVVSKNGVCPESLWPFVESALTTKPSPAAYASALTHTALQYRRVNQTIDDLKDVLCQGQPVIFGFTVYQSFEGDQIAKDGLMDMPTAGEQVVGGHAVKATGYDDDFLNKDGSKGAVFVRNSWGPDWGQHGYFQMPYAYYLDTNLVSDLWTISKCD